MTQGHYGSNPGKIESFNVFVKFVCSFGFRPGRGTHDAIRSLNRALSRGSGSWVLEIDIKSFRGDSLDRKWLMKMLQVRVADKSMLRLVGKCLKVGILDGEEFSMTEDGTTQGSSLSPLLGNVYLHYALDSAGKLARPSPPFRPSPLSLKKACQWHTSNSLASITLSGSMDGEFFGRSNMTSDSISTSLFQDGP
ncbi:hypothetical protein IV102_28575 [bacterium]|nr:hypothetical protein [bacterium]